MFTLMKILASYKDCDSALVIQVASRIQDILNVGDVLSLKGDLGAGKTFFAKALLKSMGHEGEVPSPTFSLVQVYDNTRLPVWHFDLYRLKIEEEVYELGIEEAFATSISVIEWAEKASHAMPAETLEIQIDFAEDENKRHITITGNDAWDKRLNNS